MRVHKSRSKPVGVGSQTKMIVSTLINPHRLSASARWRCFTFSENKNRVVKCHCSRRRVHTVSCMVFRCCYNSRMWTMLADISNNLTATPNRIHIKRFPRPKLREVCQWKTYKYEAGRHLTVLSSFTTKHDQYVTSSTYTFHDIKIPLIVIL